jgi:hypothetical protein
MHRNMSRKHIACLGIKLCAFPTIVRVSIQLNSVNFTSQGRPLYPLDMRYREMHAILDQVRRAKLPVPMTGNESKSDCTILYTHTHTHTHICKYIYIHTYLTKSFRPHYGPGVNSAFNRNEYQEYFLRVKAAGA